MLQIMDWSNGFSECVSGQDETGKIIVLVRLMFIIIIKIIITHNHNNNYNGVNLNSNSLVQYDHACGVL